ncbi:imidazolonepropionase-like domain-containing protein [Streptomyces sp. URMC 124]|uniref:imidazolonepropionase-like domain-containing protein n=1 Tax=Streptomyces sp. URMC 124 TaxID=3423405 RepID=UPI003F1AA612
MLTLHAADLLLTAAPGAAAVPGGAVAVDGDRIAALGPYEDVAAAHPGARVRRWPGVLTPGLRQWHAVWLLGNAYFPDPREYDELGDRPLTGERRAALEMTETRRAGSVRRGLQQMLRHGTTAVAATGTFKDPVVATAVARSGLRVVSARLAPGILTGRPDLDPFREGRDLPGSVGEPLAAGGRADLAVFDVRDEAELLEAGAGTCVATVLAGRLVHRRR